MSRDRVETLTNPLRFGAVVTKEGAVVTTGRQTAMTSRWTARRTLVCGTLLLGTLVALAAPATTTSATRMALAATGVASANQQAVRLNPPAAPSLPGSPPTTGIPTSFPSSANTGVPAGVALSAYTGPCTISAANTVIDAKRITCNLSIRAAGVRITRSQIVGGVTTDENSSASFTIEDSDIDAGSATGTGVQAVNFTVLRSEIVGGNRGVYCYRNCRVQDSYIHGQIVPSNSDAHSSGMRASQDTAFVHNTVACDARDNAAGGGCSAAITMYGDYAPVQRVLVEANLIQGDSGGYCAYGGSSGGKPYSSGASDIVYRNNVFERGSTGKCGFWGPITAFDSSRPGNVWTGNVWSNGGSVPPAN